MSQIHIQNLFPVPLMRVEAFLTIAEINAVLNEMQSTPKFKNAKTQLLSHSEAIQPQDNEHFRKVSDKTLAYLRDFGFLLFGENLTWRVKEMWMNVLATGGHQSMHSHANSFISGVVYLTACHKSANTVFHNTMGAREFVFSNTHANTATTPYNSPRWSASDVKCGDLILFPSYMLHAVPPNEGGERITLAFNALPERLKSWDYEVQFAGM